MNWHRLGSDINLNMIADKDNDAAYGDIWDCQNYPAGAFLFRALNVGVKYMVGGKREDYQSRAYNYLFKKIKSSEFWALKDIGLQGKPGDVIGIIGLNGAGKTTLCRVICGLIKPDTGSISINGSVSALFSLGTGFNPELSGRENIYLNGMMLGFSKKYLDSVAEEIILFSGIKEFIEQPLKNYSSGMRARLGFSIAAMFEPDILILDEALSTGDIHFSLKATEKLEKIISHAKMVIAVTHQLDFVAKYCTHVIWLEKGSVYAAGHPADVVPKYMEASKKIPERKVFQTSFQKTNSEVKKKIVVKTKNLGVQFFLHPQNGNSKTVRGKLKKNFWALRDVDLDIREGDIFAIIGLNGAGKTTLCRVLSGILQPDEGEVFVEGKITSLLSLGTGFNLELSGKDNIFLNGMFQGFTRKKMVDLYEEIVDFSELGDAIHQPMKHYSSGMLARLGFSIAATLRPDVFIIDEALNAGDINFYQKSAAKIQELMTLAKAAIVVTHNIQFVKSVCTRAVWLDSGRIVFQGDAQEVVDAYCLAANKTEVLET